MGGDSDHAVDGKVIRKSDTCALTDPSTSNWFAVDFGRSVYPSHIVIHAYESKYQSVIVRLGNVSY